MRKIMVGLAVLLAASDVALLAAGEQPELRISLVTPKGAYVLGEPVIASLTWEVRGAPEAEIAFSPRVETPATTLVVRGPRNAACSRQGVGKFKPMAHSTIRGRQTKPLDLSDFGIVEPGDYEIWVVYDTTSLSPEYVGVGVQLQRRESNHVAVSITPPVGIDAQAFQKYRVVDSSRGGGCDRVAVNEALLKDFPTSIYSAYYLLAKGRPGYPAGIDPPRVAAEQEYDVHRTAKDAGTTNYYDQVMAKEKESIAALEQLVRDFPDFIFRAEALTALARAYCRVGEADKAVPVLKELLARPLDPESLQVAQDYRRLLQDRGIWLPEQEALAPGAPGAGETSKP